MKVNDQGHGEHEDPSQFWTNRMFSFLLEIMLHTLDGVVVNSLIGKPDMSNDRLFEELIRNITCELSKYSEIDEDTDLLKRRLYTMLKKSRIIQSLCYP